MIPTANGVSRTLGKRHNRSVSTGTRVRGYRSTTEGYTVKTIGTGDKVLVEHQSKSGVYDPKVNYAAVREARIDSYAATLMDAGYEVEATYAGVNSRLVVTSKKES